MTAIGAGATATTTVDWHDVWQHSPEAAQLEKEINQIHVEGRNRPPVEAALHHEFSTPWGYQVSQLLKRDFFAHWRDPTYLMAKIALNIVAGLFIGFTFWKAKDTQQGTQNKLFVSILNPSHISCIRDAYVYVRDRPSS